MLTPLEPRLHSVRAGARRSLAALGRSSTAWGKLLREASYGFHEDGADLLAASLSFHTLLSIAPLIVIAVAIAGLVLGEGPARVQAKVLLSEAMGPHAAATVDGWVEQAAASSELASVVGTCLVILTASRLGLVLQDALNRVFHAPSVPDRPLSAHVFEYVRRRLLAFAWVVGTGPLFLGAVASRALLTAFHRGLFLGAPVAGVLAQLSQVLLSMGVVAFVMTLLYRLVPTAPKAWNSVLVGGMAASVLFNVGNTLIGLYLASGAVGPAYGLAGSAVAVLIWLQFSTAVFLFGAEVARAHTALSHGRGEVS